MSTKKVIETMTFFFLKNTKYFHTHTHGERLTSNSIEWREKNVTGSNS